MPRFGSRLLGSLVRENLQSLDCESADGPSASLVNHLRWQMHAIFRSAMGHGAVSVNPTLGLSVPVCKAPRVSIGYRRRGGIDQSHFGLVGGRCARRLAKRRCFRGQISSAHLKCCRYGALDFSSCHYRGNAARGNSRFAVARCSANIPLESSGASIVRMSIRQEN
jgi:hypothetical protein